MLAIRRCRWTKIGVIRSLVKCWYCFEVHGGKKMMRKVGTYEDSNVHDW